MFRSTQTSLPAPVYETGTRSRSAISESGSLCVSNHLGINLGFEPLSTWRGGDINRHKSKVLDWHADTLFFVQSLISLELLFFFFFDYLVRGISDAVLPG